MKKYKHLFFDMDGTITASKCQITNQLQDFLNTLEHTITVVSGAATTQIQKQIGTLRADILSQSGNNAKSKEGTKLWENLLPSKYTHEIYAHIDALQHKMTHTVPDLNDLVDNRGSQITFSMYGHNAPHKEKILFDPDFSIRKKLLSSTPFISKTMEVNITGTTCYDYTEKGKNKGYNINKFITHKGWKHNECLFFGDALFEGGNDYTVVGIIDTIHVQNHEDTFKILSELFTKN